MPLNITSDVFITCAITGSGSTQDRSDKVPRSPAQIAESAIAAARAVDKPDMLWSLEEFEKDNF